MPIITDCSLISLTGAFFGHLFSSFSTATRCSGILLLQGFLQLVWFYQRFFLPPWLIVEVIVVRHQFPDICALILELQNCLPDQDLETHGNGLCYCEY